MTSYNVSICIPIYNNANNFKNLFYSINRNLLKDKNGLELIVYNDGSTIEGVHEEAKDFCATKGIKYIYNVSNNGVAYAWNRLTDAAKNEVVILLNDDVRAYSEDWIEHIKYIFDKNEKIGIVYWCQKQIDPATGISIGYTKDSIQLLTRNNYFPCLRHNFAGAFFAFRKNVWSQIVQPDGSIGFWEDLLSYGEEIDFSAEFLNHGYSIVQLPIISEHFRSQTFTANPEKKIRANLSSYLSLDELYEIFSAYSAYFGLSRTDTLLLSIRKILNYRNIPFTGVFTSQTNSKLHKVFRLDYSLAMLLKKWSYRKILGFEGVQYLEKMYMTGYPSALNDAVTLQNFVLPEKIYFLDAYQSPKLIDAQACIDCSYESLI